MVIHPQPLTRPPLDIPLMVNSDECNMEFSCKAKPSKHRPRKDPNQEGNVETQTSPRKNRNQESRKSTIEPALYEAQPTAESEFWERNPELSTKPSEQTLRELRVFKRVHLQAMSESLQKILKFDASHFLQYDIMHTRAKFPEAENYLIERLGHAVSRRRQYFRYHEEQHNKSTKEIETLGSTEWKIENTDGNSTSASTFPTTENRPERSTGMPNEMLDRSEKRGSQPNTEIKLDSIPANIPVIPTPTTPDPWPYSLDDLSYDIPLYPRLVEDQIRERDYFECHLCFRSIAALYAHEWL